MGIRINPLNYSNLRKMTYILRTVYPWPAPCILKTSQPSEHIVSNQSVNPIPISSRVHQYSLCFQPMNYHDEWGYWLCRKNRKGALCTPVDTKGTEATGVSSKGIVRSLCRFRIARNLHTPASKPAQVVRDQCAADDRR